MGKINWRGSRLVSATMPRIAGDVRKRLGRFLITPLPQESVGKQQVSTSEPATCPHYLPRRNVREFRLCGAYPGGAETA
jgi:hypothetical protein